MRIYLIRHSAPEDVSGDDDDDPSLSDEGRKIAEALADWMRDKDEIPTILYASPMQRTQETAAILKDKLDIMPRVATDLSIGPHMSIRSLVKRVSEDKSQVRVGIVSHHESMEHGLRELNRDPWVHLDIFAQGECRIMKVDRKDGSWKEHNRVLPSDLGGSDHY